MSTCTSGKCEWKRRCGNNEYAIPFQDLKIVKAEFGKTEKEPVKPVNFEPGHSSFDAGIMKDMLRTGLQEVFPQAVALQFLPRPREPEIPESLHLNITKALQGGSSPFPLPLCTFVYPRVNTT